ncbi:MAG: hypothetical protein ABIH46_06280 [Chloroflexota bacterium]
MATDQKPQIALPGSEGGPFAFLFSLALMPLQMLQGIFQGLNSMMSSGQMPMLPLPFAQSTRSNDEVEEIERDERGFIIRRTVKRVVK